MLTDIRALADHFLIALPNINTYIGRLISERPDHWTYGVVQAHQSRLDPLLGALKKLHEEGLTAALVLSAVHHRRVLPLMSRLLRMDEMGSGVSSRDLEACRMSNEAPVDDVVAARVRRLLQAISSLSTSTASL